jgi:uncharacterized OB-fold protein
MGNFGTVIVKNGQYKLKGEFHTLSAGTPIRDADHGWRLMGVTNPRAITHVHMYGGEAAFFEGLPQGKIFGSRCDAPGCVTQGSIYLPFRIHCPECLGRNAVVDLTDLCRRTAKVHTFMVCERSGAFNTLDKPIRFINVEFEGVVTILMSNLLLGEPKIGMRVTPIFRTLDPTYTITDLAWVPEGTKEARLPVGFTFG